MAENLPANWQLTTLENVCKLSQGEKLTGKNFPYLEVKYLRGVKSAKIVESGNFISAGTKIILVDGENSGEIFTTPENGYLGSTFRTLKIFENVDADFFQYFISTKKELYHSKKRGSAIPHLDKKIFFLTNFPVPPLAEQKRIVSLLDSLFEKLDAASDALKSVFNAVALHKVYLLKNAFDGALTAKFRANTGISKDDWQEKTLGEIAEIIMGQSPKGDSTTMDSKYTPLIGGAADIGELFPKISRYTKTPTKLTTTEDIIICIRATLGKPIFSDGVYCLGRGVAAIRPHSILKNFLRYVFINFEQYFYDNAAGSTFLQIPSTKLKNFPIPVPPLAEQKEIARLLDIFITKENRVKEIAEKTLQQIDALKKNILARAFRGELGTNNLEN